MAIRNLSRERAAKGSVIIAACLLSIVVGIMGIRQVGWALIIEVSYVLIVLIVFAFIYDRYLIR